MFSAEGKEIETNIDSYYISVWWFAGVFVTIVYLSILGTFPNWLIEPKPIDGKDEQK